MLCGCGSTIAAMPSAVPATVPVVAPAPIASPAPTTAPAPVAPVAPVTPTTAPSVTGYIVPGRGANGQSALDTRPVATPGLQLTTPADRPAVDTMLAQLRRSATGAAVLDGIERQGAKITVLDDAEFTAAGEATTGAYFDPRTDTIVLRRSDLQRDPARAATVFAHEATHALDDHGQVGAAWLQAQITHHTNAGTLTPALTEQISSSLTVAKEARSFTVQAQVMRELGVQPQGALAEVVRTGANDRATYQTIFTMIAQAGPAGGYNTSGASIAPFEV